MERSIPADASRHTRALRAIGLACVLILFLLNARFFSAAPVPVDTKNSTAAMANQHSDGNYQHQPSHNELSDDDVEDDDDIIIAPQHRPTIKTITTSPVDDDGSATKDSSSSHYGYVVLIASEPHQQSRRALIREKYFGLRDNLVPCMQHNTDVYYKFWIYGSRRPRSAAQQHALEQEALEWNDMVQTDEQVFDQEKILKWASQALAVTYDYVILQDIHTFIHLPTIKRALDAGLIGDDSDQPYVVSTEQPLNLVWGSFTGRAVDKQAAIVGATAAEVLLRNQHQQRLLARRSAHFLTNMYWYYQAVEKELMEETDAKLGPEEAVEEQARIIPSFVRQDFMMQWENNVESVQAGRGCVVANVMQDGDFAELASWTRLRSIPVCVHHRSSSYYYQQLVVVTSSIGQSSSCTRSAGGGGLIENKRAYALRHGYAFVPRSAEFIQQTAKGRSPEWGRIDAMEKTLPKYKWLLWLSPEVLVADVEQPVPPASDDAYDLVMNERGTVVLLRNSVWARQFLRQVQRQQMDDPVAAIKLTLQQHPDNSRHALVLQDFAAYTGSRKFAVHLDRCRADTPATDWPRVA